MSEYIEVDDLKKAFKDYLMKFHGFDEITANRGCSDFPDPYSNSYLFEDYIDIEEINGDEYEKNASHTNFCMCYGFDNDAPFFKFYTFYKLDDIPNTTVGEYKKAKKLYSLDIDETDFK